MLAILMMTVVLLGLIVALGLPYNESWYHRWGDSDR